MELEALIGECTVYDFKVMLEEKKPKSWLKSVSAFANGLGGSLFFGIDNVMAQLYYMEKRGSGLKRIYNKTKALDGYRDDLKPVFKSTTSQFMTIIYSVKYDAKENENAAKPVERKEEAVIKQSLSNHQVIVKLSLSISNICDLLRKMISPMSAKNMRYFCGQKDSTYFKANVGLNNEYKLINEQHLLYSNIFNMKDEGDGIGLAMMRDIKFYYPKENNFRYVKFIVDRLEQAESELRIIKNGISNANM